MAFLIGTDSTADLPESFIKERNITVFELTTNIGGETYGTDKKLDVKNFYGLLRNGENATTSQVNPDEAKENLLKMLEKGNEILYVAFSSGLSGTFNSVRLAAEEICEDNPDAKIIVIDSKCASLGEGLLVNYIADLRDEGKTIDEAATWANEHALNVVHMFTVDDLNFLFRGGRVSKSAALLGTVLNIKPVLHVDDEGHLVPLSKVRGRKKALLSLVDGMEEKIGSFVNKIDVFYVSHGDCIEDAEFVRDEVKSRFHIDDSMINFVGPVVGSHSGPGTVALFFMGDNR